MAMTALSARGLLCTAVLLLELDANNTGLSARAVPELENSARDWEELVEWIVSNGGTVHKGLRKSFTHHGGLEIGGVVASEDLRGNGELIRIPRSIMLEADKFPMLDPLVAERCRWMGPNDVEESKLSAGIALEAKQGNSSKFHSYLKILPKLADFRSYHPLFMTGSLLQEFQDLPLTRHASAQATKLQKLQGCFDDWRASALSPVASLRWEDFLWASLVQLTRHYRMHGARAMMPAIDSINTAAKGRWNVAVQPKYFSDVEEVKLGPGGLRAGAEALIPFCDSCDNSQMLLQWGIYLEDNSVLIQDLFEAPKANCSRSLQEVTIASLDVSASTAEAARLAGWAAPRCRQDLMSAIEDQGPLRCSLARLAWERCSEAWGQRGWRGLAPHWQQRCQQAAALMSYLVPGSAAARFILYGTLFLLPYGLFFFAILRRGAARTIAAKESQRKKRGGNAMDQPSTLPA